MKSKFLVLSILALLLGAFTGIAQTYSPGGMPGEVVPQSQTVLDDFFVTSNTPTQLDYWELIDTEFWYIQFIYTNSQSILTKSILSANLQPTNPTKHVTYTGALQTNTVTMNLLINGGMPPFNITNLLNTANATEEVNTGLDISLTTYQTNGVIVPIEFNFSAQYGSSSVNTLNTSWSVTDASGQVVDMTGFIIITTQ